MKGYGLFRTACKGICVRHKVRKPGSGSRYAAGHKRCMICEIFIEWPGLHCPCCGYRLRNRRVQLKPQTTPIEKRENVVMLDNGVPVRI